MTTNEFAFEMVASSVRFGAGVTREVGQDLVDLGVRRALVVTDPNLVARAPVQTVLQSLSDAGVTAVLYDRVRVEPTDVSFKEAIAFANAHPTEGIVAVGGGSVIDTAKAVNLYTTYPPDDFLDYVNAPIGKAKPIPGPLKPLIATLKPVLHIHVVGVNPVIEAYVKAKHTAGTKVGIQVDIVRHPADITEDALLAAVKESAEVCDGMIVQLPLPEHIDRQKVLNTIPVDRDADLLSEKTWLRFENEITPLVPPVAGAVMLALDAYNIDVYRKKVAIVGYGKLVGQPVAIVLKRRGAYIDVIDSKTSELAKQKVLREAEVVVTGVGRRNLIQPEDVHEGVVLLDGGTSESEGGTAGDIDLLCESKASYFARVPGGLGPLTVASLLKNVVELAKERRKS